MSTDHVAAQGSRFALSRFSLTTLLIVVAAIAVALTIGLELSKTEVSGCVLVKRTISDSSWPKGWDDEMNGEDYEAFFRTQVEWMRSRMLLTRAIRDPAIKPLLPAGNGDPVDWLRKNVKFERPNQGELLRISLSSHDPAQGVALVKAIMDCYFKEVVEQQVVDQAKAEQKINKLYEQLREKLLQHKIGTANLLTTAGDDIAKTADLELRQLKTRQLERDLDDVASALHKARMRRNMPTRVQRLGDPSAGP
jgi:uncharacterized protein involved in exopolysaccharide biosynthesis